MGTRGEIRISPDRRRFYCHKYDRWYPFGKLGGARGCFHRGCVRMYAPPGVFLGGRAGTLWQN